MTTDRQNKIRQEHIGYIDNEIKKHKTCVAREDSSFCKIALEESNMYNVVMNGSMAVIIPC